MTQLIPLFRKTTTGRLALHPARAVVPPPHLRAKQIAFSAVLHNRYGKQHLGSHAAVAPSKCLRIPAEVAASLQMQTQRIAPGKGVQIRLTTFSRVFYG